MPKFTRGAATRLNDYMKELKFLDNSKEADERREEIRKAMISPVPQCKKTSLEVTAHIQKVAPEYYYVEDDPEIVKSRRELSETARTKIYRQHLVLETNKYALAGKEIFGDREQGARFGLYVETFLPQLGDKLLELAEMKNDPEKQKEFNEGAKDMHRAVMNSAMSKAPAFESSLTNPASEYLVLEWDKISAFTRVCDVQNSLLKLAKDDWYTEKERTDIYDNLEPFMSRLNQIEDRIDVIANPLYAVADVDQLLRLSSNQAFRLAEMEDEGVGIFDTTGSEYTWNIFETIDDYGGNEVSMLLGEASQRLEAGKDSKVKMFDIDGNELDMAGVSSQLNEKHMPVVFKDVKNPDKPALTAYIDNGKQYFGEAAVDKFLHGSAAARPYPVNTPEPGRIASMWDRFCKAVGLTSLRPKSCVQYELECNARDTEDDVCDKIDELRSTIKQKLSDLGQKFRGDEKGDFAADVDKMFKNNPKLSASLNKETFVELHEVLAERRGKLNSYAEGHKVPTGEERTKCLAEAMTIEGAENALREYMKRMSDPANTDKSINPLLLGLVKMPKKGADSPKERCDRMKKQLDFAVKKFTNSEAVMKAAKGMSKDEFKMITSDTPSVRVTEKVNELTNRARSIADSPLPNADALLEAKMRAEPEQPKLEQGAMGIH